jgi:DNA-binding PadR family transcriptional regulator
VELTPLEYALLGLLGMAPSSGYDVKKVFDSTPLAHFSSSPGAIYPALKRLARKGLLEATLDTTTEARPRRVFSLTEAGSKALVEWVRQEVTEDELVRDGRSPMLRFVLAEGRLSPDEVIAYLEGLGRVLRAYLEKLYGHRGDVKGVGQLHTRLALEDGIRGYEAMAGWVDFAIAEIKACGKAD